MDWFSQYMFEIQLKKISVVNSLIELQSCLNIEA